jgi:hypothetical protein
MNGNIKTHTGTGLVGGINRPDDAAAAPPELVGLVDDVPT